MCDYCDFREYTLEELFELKEDVICAITKRMEEEYYGRVELYDKVKRLKEEFTKLEGKKLSLEILGEDICLRIEYPYGFMFSLENFDSLTEEEIRTYNVHNYDELVIRSKAPDSENREIKNFYIPLYVDFVAGPDAELLKNDPEDILNIPTENIVYVIHMDTLDYIFQADI